MREQLLLYKMQILIYCDETKFTELCVAESFPPCIPKSDLVADVVGTQPTYLPQPVWRWPVCQHLLVSARGPSLAQAGSAHTQGIWTMCLSTGHQGLHALGLNLTQQDSYDVLHTVSLRAPPTPLD